MAATIQHRPAPITLITGIMAAGKSTVAQALAERFERGVHLRGDIFRRAVVSGRAEMTAAPTAEALAQLRVRYELAATAAQRYADAGFTTVVQDIVIGPMLEEVLAMYSTRPLALVVLAPSAEVVAEREAQRHKTGYRDVTPHDLDAVLRNATARRGLWLDTSELTVDETVQAIIDRADPEAFV